MDQCQAFVAALVGVAEFVLVEAHLVQQGGMDVAEMAAVGDGMQANVVGGSDDFTASNSATGHPHGEAQVVMISALGF